MKSARITIYSIGVILMALGFILNAKSGLGITPICSLAYCVSYITGTSFSDMAMILFALCFVVALLVRRKKLHWTDFLQLAYCVVFTRVMSAFAALLPSPESMAVRIIILFIAVICVGTGASMSLAMHIVPNPGDYMVNAIGNKIHKSLGLTKNIMDIVLVACTCIVALIFRKNIFDAGIGIGTLVPMVLVGRQMALVNHFFLDKFNHIYKSAYIKVFDDKKDDEVAV